MNERFPAGFTISANRLIDSSSNSFEYTSLRISLLSSKNFSISWLVSSATPAAGSVLLNLFSSLMSSLDVSGCTICLSESGSLSISSSWLLPRSVYSGLKCSEYPSIEYSRLMLINRLVVDASSPYSALANSAILL